MLAVNNTVEFILVLTNGAGVRGKAEAVGCAGDSSVAGLWGGVSQGVLQPLGRVVTGLADSTAVMRHEFRSVVFPGCSGGGKGLSLQGGPVGRVGTAQMAAPQDSFSPHHLFRNPRR